MSDHEIESIVREHPFFHGIREDDIEFISNCGKEVQYGPGQALAREGSAADRFFLIRTGSVAIETSVPRRGSVTLQTLGKGEIVGWSWLFPPYQWTIDVRAIEPTVAIALDGACLREKCETDPQLGFLLMKKLSRVLSERLHATRFRLLDVYGISDPHDEAAS